MAIDFTFPPEIEEVRHQVRRFLDEVVRPAEREIDRSDGDREVLVKQVIAMRSAAREWGLWLPHMPEEYGGMGLGHVAMASVSAEAARTRFAGSDPTLIQTHAVQKDDHWLINGHRPARDRGLLEGRPGAAGRRRPAALSPALT